MEVTVRSLAQYCAVLVILSSLSFGSCQVENKNDQELRSYLERVMRNYTTYIKQNKFDPTPIPPSWFASGLHSGGSFRAQLDCELGNHIVSGLSKSENTGISTFSNFTDHMFAVRLATYGSFNFQGTFSCSGKVKMLWGSELDLDIPFSGNGTFLVKANVLVETFKARNFGITQDGRLNLPAYNRPEYELRMNATYVQLQGIWSDPVVTHNYLDHIQKTFLHVYGGTWNQHYPTEDLLDGYLRKITDGLRLADILTDYK